jgi:DNA-binding CsgD family transcriptional regulator
MKTVIIVCIHDVNRFFALGIQHILLPYFQVRGKGVCFVGMSEVARADLVFFSVDKGWPLQQCQLYVPGRSMEQIFIAIRSSQSAKTIRCKRVQGTLDSRAYPRELLSLVDAKLKAPGSAVPKVSCPCCKSPALTRREQDVLRYMSWALAPKGLPQYLNISQKTASAHKRAAMRKLGFKRNSELYHWLLLNGLDQIKRP